MKTARKITLLSLVVLCCLIVFGCGKDDEPAPTTPPTATKAPDKPTPTTPAETSEMNLEQLKAAALKCKADFEAKSVEVDEKAKEVMKALAGNKPKEERTRLNTEMTELNKEAEALARQLQDYVKLIKEKGGDVSTLDLDK